MLDSRVYRNRLQTLEQNIIRDMELLKEFEEALRFTSDPRLMGKYRQDIERQKESIEKYQQEIDELQKKLENSSAITQMKVREVNELLHQMDRKLNVLLSGQVAIYENLGEMREALISRYEVAEQKIVFEVTKRLDQDQLLLTQYLLDSLEANQISELQVNQMLKLLEEQSYALTSSQPGIAEVLKDPELDARHRLKVTLPIVPMLVEYEGELELNSGFNIKSIWNYLLSKLQRKQTKNI